LGFKEAPPPLPSRDHFEKKFKIKKPLSVLVISKKPHITVGFHKNPEKRS
jgi:hypothetical protein